MAGDGVLADGVGGTVGVALPFDVLLGVLADGLRVGEAVPADALADGVGEPVGGAVPVDALADAVGDALADALVVRP